MEKVTVFKVAFSTAKQMWQVRAHGQNTVGYQAWNQRVATSYAKEEAKKMRPSRIFIYKKNGRCVPKKIEYLLAEK